MKKLLFWIKVAIIDNFENKNRKFKNGKFVNCTFIIHKN